MRLSDVLALSLRQLRERRLRSVLTVLAIAVGVTSIIALSAQVEGIKESITQSLQVLGPDTVMVMSGFGAGQRSFTDADVVRVGSLDGVARVTPTKNMRATVVGTEDSVSVVGVSSLDLASLLGGVNLLEGSLYRDVAAPQALLGYDIAVDESGQLTFRVGQPILFQAGQRSITMTVVGILDTYGSSAIVQPDDSVYISREYMRLLEGGGGYSSLLVKARSAEEVDRVTELIGYVFGGNAVVMSVKQITAIVVSITSQVNLLLLAIAGTSFIAAGLGTFNIMMISVLERVREIGILKALGMKDKGVLTLYMTQGLLLGLFGSLAGLGLGAVTAYALPIILSGAFSMGGVSGQTSGIPTGQNGGMGAMGGMGIMSSYTPVIGSTYLGISVGVSLVVALLSSIYPAWKASKMSPVDALRYE